MGAVAGSASNAPVNKEIEAWCYLARSDWAVIMASGPGRLGFLYTVLKRKYSDEECMRVMSEYANRYITHAAVELEKCAPRMVFEEGSELETLVIGAIGQFHQSGDALPLEDSMRDEILAELYDWELLLIVNKVYRMGSEVGLEDQKTATELLNDFLAKEDQTLVDGTWLSDRRAARRTELIQIISKTSPAMLAQTLLREIDFPASTERLKRCMDKWRAQMEPVRWLEGDPDLADYEKKYSEAIEEVAKLRGENDALREVGGNEHPAEQISSAVDVSVSGSELPGQSKLSDEGVAELERLKATVANEETLKEVMQKIREQTSESLGEAVQLAKHRHEDPQYEYVAKYTKDGMPSIEKVPDGDAEGGDAAVRKTRGRRKRDSSNVEKEGEPSQPRKRISAKQKAAKGFSSESPIHATPGSASLAVKETWATPSGLSGPGGVMLTPSADDPEIPGHRRVQKRVGKFTPEEDTLIRDGLAKHGWGNWAPILNDGGFPQGRTPVHLKDRARTLKLKATDFPPRPRGGRGRPPATTTPKPPQLPTIDTPAIPIVPTHEEPPIEMEPVGDGDGTRQIEGPEVPPET